MMASKQRNRSLITLNRTNYHLLTLVLRTIACLFLFSEFININLYSIREILGLRSGCSNLCWQHKFKRASFTKFENTTKNISPILPSFLCLFSKEKKIFNRRGAEMRRDWALSLIEVDQIREVGSQKKKICLFCFWWSCCCCLELGNC